MEDSRPASNSKRASLGTPASFRWASGVQVLVPDRPLGVMQERMHERACMSACTHDDEVGKHLTLT